MSRSLTALYNLSQWLTDYESRRFRGRRLTAWLQREELGPSLPVGVEQGRDRVERIAEFHSVEIEGNARISLCG